MKQRHQHFRFIPLSSVPTLVGHDLTAISTSFGNKKLHHFETKSHTWSLLVWQTLLSAQGNVQISRSNSGTKQSTFASTLFSANKIRCAGRSRKLLDVCWLTNSPPPLCESRGLSQLDANIVGSEISACLDDFINQNASLQRRNKFNDISTDSFLKYAIYIYCKSCPKKNLIVNCLSFPMMQNIFRDLQKGCMGTGQGQILEATAKIAHTLLEKKSAGFRSILDHWIIRDH